jgi:hypothetical protein
LPLKPFVLANVKPLLSGAANSIIGQILLPDVGHTQYICRFIDFVHYSQSSVLAPDGKCKPFDAAADGCVLFQLIGFLLIFPRFGRGEGVVVMVVKLLDEAIRDGDHIYASVSSLLLHS